MTARMRAAAIALSVIGWSAVLAQPAGPRPDHRSAFIQVKCEPGVKIMVDGKESGTTARELGGLVIQDVAPGTYVIQALKEGFRPQELRTTVQPGTVQLLYVLPFQERAAASAANGRQQTAIGQRTGALVVRTVPVDCRLRIPALMVDSDKSAAEWHAEAVPAGTYEIEVAAWGQTLKQAVIVAADKTAEVMFNFVRSEVSVMAALPVPASQEAVSTEVSLEEQLKRTEESLRETERELGEVRTALQSSPAGEDLGKIRRMMARRDELARRQRDLGYELNVLNQRVRLEAEDARREATQRRHRAFDADYLEYGRLVRDPDIPYELKGKAWQALCQAWSVDPGNSAGRLLWDETKGAPTKVVSHIVQLEGGVDLVLVEIVAGSFAMGAEDGDDDEKPVHTVTITRPFWIGKYEVTQDQYRVVMGTTPSHFRGENRPVENVTWQDADAFCRRLTERQRKAGLLSHEQEIRLPTEAEWEYACRAGSTTLFSAGERLDPTLANYDVSQGAGRSGAAPARETLPVGSLKANAWDLHDMHGNVWEWCADWYDREYYSRSPPTNPFNVRPSGLVTCRGGSWMTPASFCRSANRNSSDARQANHMTGFRVVLAPPAGL